MGSIAVADIVAMGWTKFSLSGNRTSFEQASGIAAFKDLQVDSKNINADYNITLHFGTSGLESEVVGLLDTKMLACTPGEQPPKKQVGNFSFGQCTPCDQGQFILPGQLECSACELGAKCQNGVRIRCPH